jgi:hypothetical protein
LKTESSALCCRLHMSAPRLPPHCAASCRTQPLTTGPPSRPRPPVSHAIPRRPDPAALHSHARNAAACAHCGRAAAARCRIATLSPPCPCPPLSLSHSRSASTRCPPLQAPSLSLPFKTEPPPAGQIFSPVPQFSPSPLRRQPQPPPSPPLEPQARPAAHQSPRSPAAAAPPAHVEPSLG